MKKLFTFALLCLTLSACAQVTSVSFPLNTLFGGAAYNRQLTLTAANTLISDGQNLWAGTYTLVPASTTNPVVGLYPNTYLLTVPGVVKPVRFTVPASTNVLDVTTLLVSGPLFYFGTNGMANLIAGTNFVFVTNSDGSITLNTQLPGYYITNNNASAVTLSNNLTVNNTLLVSGNLTATNGTAQTASETVYGLTGFDFIGGFQAINTTNRQLRDSSANLVATWTNGFNLVEPSNLGAGTNLSGPNIVGIINPTNLPSFVTNGASPALNGVNITNIQSASLPGSVVTNGLWGNIAFGQTWTGTSSTNASFYPSNCNVGFFAIQQTNQTGAAVNNLHFLFGNFPVHGLGPASDQRCTNAVIYTGSLEYPIGTFTRVTFGGSASVTVGTNQTVMSDVIPTILPTNAVYRCRTYVWTYTNCAFPTPYQINPFGGFVDYYLLGTNAADWTMSATNGLQTGTLYGYCPIVVGSRVGIANATPITSVSLIGDSRIAGISYFPTKLVQLGIPTICMAAPGNSFETESNVLIWDAPVTSQASTAIICQLDVNSIYGNADTFQQLTNAFIGWALPQIKAGKKVYLCTCTPYTTSSDGWTTLVNQTLYGTGNPVRVQWNNWVRQGANGLISGYFELADIVESSRDSGLWSVVSGDITSDGLHPNTLGYAILGTNLNLSCLLGSQQTFELVTNLYAGRNLPAVSVTASNITLNASNTLNIITGGGTMYSGNGNVVFGANQVQVTTGAGFSVTYYIAVGTGIQDQGPSSSLTLDAHYSHLLALSESGNIGITVSNKLIRVVDSMVLYTNTVFANLQTAPGWAGLSNAPSLWSSNNVGNTAVPVMYRTYYDAATNAHTAVTGF
jgi:hypothetical protein